MNEGYLQISAADRGIYLVEELRRLIADNPRLRPHHYSPEGPHWLVVSGYRGSDVF